MAFGKAVTFDLPPSPSHTPAGAPARKMTEPRARVAHSRGQQNFAKELRILLYAYGDVRDPLDETVKVLDEMVTDFIIETCHEAAAHASYSRRQKIKVDDFTFALRNDPMKLGRVHDLLAMEKDLKKARKVFNEKDDRVFAAEAEKMVEEGG